MKLQIGERLSGSGPANQPGGYLVTEVLSETPWSGLYAARKVFYNFDFTGKRPRETEEKESLDVLLRTVNYPRLDSAEYVLGRRTLACAEGRAVLANRTSNLWPEPLDLLEVHNTRDPFTYPREPAAGGQTPSRTALGPTDAPAREPIVVLARPHGDTLIRWLQAAPPFTIVLSVVAELLEFLASCHDDGLLLNGLGPLSLLVDRAGRLHYLGTDTVVPLPVGTSCQLVPDPGQAGSLSPRTAPDWREFFPPERYARGYSAPECFDPAAPRDRRTDLYAWATIAYLLLTNERPAQLAFEQGQPWARFDEPQFARAAEALRAVPQERVAIWAEQLGLEAEALRHGWPDNFVNGLRRCLSPDPRQRPPSVADLRLWIVAPPPPPPTAVLALRLPRSDTIRLYYARVEPGLEVVVRRGVGSRPAAADQGDLVAEGAATGWAEDTFPRRPAESGGDPDDFTNPPGEAVRYAVFTRRRHAGRVACSEGTPAHLLDPFPNNLRRLAEGRAAPGTPDEPEPPIVGLLFQALDTTRVAEYLLASALPQVRGWALRRVAEARHRPGASPSLETLLLRSLQDTVLPLRLEAVRGLVTAPLPPTEALLRRVFEALAATHPEDCTPVARLVKSAGVREEVLRPVLAALNLDLPTNCPVCAAELEDRDTAAHLVSVHGYLVVEGTPLPRADALARLWDRVFTAGDTQAHERLCSLLIDESAEGIGAPYLAALEEESVRRADTVFTGPLQVARLVQCLRQGRAARPLFPGLLCSADARVREISRELLLPDLAERLSLDEPTAADLRRELDALCPPGLIEEKILLCRRLAVLGGAGGAVAACLRQLEVEKPIACSECGRQVPQGEYDVHLRRVHHVYEFRGGRRTLPETVAVLLGAVCGASPDPEAWAALEGVAREEHGERADGVLAAWLGKELLQLAAEERAQAAGAAAEAIAASGSGPRLVVVLAGPGVAGPLQPVVALLALEMVTRLPTPLAEGLLQAVKPVLADRRVAAEARTRALAAVLRTTGKAGPAAVDVLCAHVAGLGKSRSIEVLHELEQTVGQAEAIDALCAELESQVRMSCPRCRVELQRLEMEKHLWDRHRLMLHGRRVREPWRMLEDWVEDYRLEQDAALLERCRALAARLDPAQGLAQFNRLLLQRGVEDAEARRGLVEQARKQGATLCPHCYAPLAPPAAVPPLALYVGNRGLSAAGYRVEVRDSGLSARLEVRTPDELVYHGVEPGKGWTRKGALLYLAGPPLLAAGALAYLMPSWGVPPWVPAAGCAGLGMLIAGAVRLLWRAPGDPRERALRHAWGVLVPRLAARGFPGESLPLTASLANAGISRGEVRDRAEALEAACQAAEELTRTNPSLGLCAGVVARLAVEDRGKEAEDVVSVLADELARCLTGEMPLTFASGLLHPREVPGWGEGEHSRLRVLLCQRAFNAGLEAADLCDLGRACAPLGALLNVEDAGSLAQLRLLWSLRERRSWEEIGPAVTVFEVADSSDAADRLEQCPDLLLAAEGEPPLDVCCRGVVRPEVGGAAERLRAWVDYYTRRFLPQVAAVQKRRSPGALRPALEHNTVGCPACQQPLVPCPGEVGLAVTTAAVPASAQPAQRHPGAPAAK